MPDRSASGMTCGHCKAAVVRARQTVDPAAEVTIDRAAGRVAALPTPPPSLLGSGAKTTRVYRRTHSRPDGGSISQRSPCR